MLIRLTAGLLAVWPLLSLAAWQTLDETPEGVRLIDPARVEARGASVRFHERLMLREGQVDSASLRPLREVLERRVLDCRTRQVATLSRAVFSDQDVLIEHEVTRLQSARWQPLAAGDPRVSLLCRRP